MPIYLRVKAMRMKYVVLVVDCEKNNETKYEIYMRIVIIDFLSLWPEMYEIYNTHFWPLTEENNWNEVKCQIIKNKYILLIHASAISDTTYSWLNPLFS